MSEDETTLVLTHRKSWPPHWPPKLDVLEPPLVQVKSYKTLTTFRLNGKDTLLSCINFWSVAVRLLHGQTDIHTDGGCLPVTTMPVFASMRGPLLVTTVILEHSNRDVKIKFYRHSASDINNEYIHSRFNSLLKCNRYKNVSIIFKNCGIQHKRYYARQRGLRLLRPQPHLRRFLRFLR